MYLKIKIMLALLVACTLSIFIYQYLQWITEETTVVIAVREIPKGQRVIGDMLMEVKVRQKEKESLAKGAATSLKEVEKGITMVDIRAGQPIDLKSDVWVATDEMLQKRGVLNANGDINLAYFMAKDKRLVTIRVDSQGAINHAIQIGDFVDVIATFKSSEVTAEFSTIVLQHIEVFSLELVNEKQKNGNKEIAQNVTLVVSPDEMLQLSFAKRNATLDLALNPVGAKGKIQGTVNRANFLKIGASNETSR